MKAKPDILKLERERIEWSLRAFPEATAQSSLEKLRDEADEIEKSLVDAPDPIEYADALMCLFDSAYRAGITPEKIFEAFETKLAINKKRNWKKNPNNSYSHI
ncbi:MAG TPA: dATP/dGTP pyrophosphohydrolase domain-containing protein [Cyclobacteriaceae bacterium]|jgi:hypothetical protein|nr:dATP/dGTP pyrophosphohydrolase domain-containing protein [Cyclobacteriaceae bacterium]